mgnify:CR=1 FL=1
MTLREHWQQAYGRRATTAVSWFRPHLDVALQLFDSLNLPPDSAIVDAGAGASTWVDDLVARGYTHLTAIDLSPDALDVARARLGDRGAHVRWLAADICEAPIVPGSVDLWHDRAAFQFHVTDADRDRYRAALHRALRPGGYAIVSTFADDGPERCSGLPTARYDGPGLAAALGLTLVASHRHVHRTPAGAEQRFVTALLRR